MTRSSPSQGADFRHEVKAQSLSIDDPVLESLLPERSVSARSSTMWSCFPARATSSTSRPCTSGRLSPVFFGSALTNFGVEPFLKKFLQMTPPPTAAHRGHRRDRPVRPAFLRIRVQDPGEHEQGAPRPRRIHAHLLGQVRARSGGSPRSGRQENVARCSRSS